MSEFNSPAARWAVCDTVPSYPTKTIAPICSGIANLNECYQKTLKQIRGLEEKLLFLFKNGQLNEGVFCLGVCLASARSKVEFTTRN